MLEQKLIKLGFSKNEVKVYLALFELGKAKAGKIIERTDLHRNPVYLALESLEIRKLISKTTKKGVAEFTVNNPEHLLEEIEQKKKITTEIVDELKSKHEDTPREIVIYEDLEGIKRATRQNLESTKGEIVYVLGASKHSQVPDLSMDWRKYHEKRIKKGIKFKAMYGTSTEESNIFDKNQLPLTDVKYLPLHIDPPFWFNICGDTSSIVFVDKNPIAINIKSKRIADNLIKYFDYLWSNEK